MCSLFVSEVSDEFCDVNCGVKTNGAGLMEIVMASQTANSNVALNGRDIVIDYIKFKNPNIDEIFRSQFITKKAKAATKTLRAEGKVDELLIIYVPSPAFESKAVIHTSGSIESNHSTF